MIIEKTSPHDLETTCNRLTDAVKAAGFGVMHVHDIHASLNSKGVEFSPACRVFEVCNPKRAAEVLGAQISLANALPCRIAVTERNGEIQVSTVTPTSILTTLNSDKDLQAVAESVEASMLKMIDDTVAA